MTVDANGPALASSLEASPDVQLLIYAFDYLLCPHESHDFFPAGCWPSGRHWTINSPQAVNHSRLASSLAGKLLPSGRLNKLARLHNGSQ